MVSNSGRGFVLVVSIGQDVFALHIPLQLKDCVVVPLEVALAMLRDTGEKTVLKG